MSTPKTLKVQGSLNVIESATINGPTTLSSLSASGDLVIAGNVTIAGGLVVVASSQIGTQHFSSDPTSAQTFNSISAQTLQVATTATAGTLTVNNQSTLNGLTASGAVAFNNSLTSSGNVTLGSASGTTVTLLAPATLNSLTVQNAANFNSSLSTSALAVTNASVLNGLTAVSVNVSNATTLATLSTSGTASFGGTVNVPAINATNLTASGTSQFNNNVTIASGKTLAAGGNVTVGGTSFLSGAATLSSTLGVTGLSTLNSLTVASGTTNLLSTAVIGPLTVSTTLAAAGNCTLGGTLSVAQPATFASNLTVASTKTLSADIASFNSTTSGTLTSTGASTLNSLTVTAATSLQQVAATSITGSSLSLGLGTVSAGAISATSAALTGSISATAGSISGTCTANALTVTTSVNAATLTTTGNASLASASVSGTFGVTGNSTFSNATLSGTMTTPNLVVTTGTATIPVLNATTLTTSALTVQNSSTLNALTASTASFTDNVTVASGKTLTTGAIVAGPVSATTGSFSSSVAAASIAVTGTVIAINATLTGTVTANQSVIADLCSATRATIATTLSAGSTTVSALTVSGSTVLQGTTTGALSAAASTLNSLTVSGATSLAATTASTLQASGASTLASVSATGLTVSGTSNLQAVTGAAATLASLNVTGNTVLQGTTTGSLTAAASTLVSLSVSGSTTLAATSVAALQASGTSTLASVTSTGITVSGTSALQGVTGTSASLGSLAVSGATTLTGSLSAGATTTAALTAGNTTVNNLVYNGQLYQGNALLQFAPAGFTMLVPAVNASVTVSAGSALVQLTLTPPVQTAFGFNSVMLPAISGINVTVNGSTTLVAFSNTINFYCYTGTNSGSNIYGFSPGSTLTAIKLQYVNDVSTSAVLTVGNSAFLTAGVPAAPALAQTTTGLSAAITLTAPTVTDNLHTAQVPQPPLVAYTSTVAETSSISDAALTTVHSITLPSTQGLRPGTVYNVTATATNAINTNAGAAASLYFVSAYDGTIPFVTGTVLTNGTPLPTPSTGRFAATNYINLANTLLSSSDILLGPNWSVTVSNLRANQEQHPTSTVLPMATISMLYSLGASLNQDLFWTDSVVKTLSAQYSTLTCSAMLDSNSGSLTGFYKQIPLVTLAIAGCGGQNASQTVTLTQTLKQQGSWAYAANALTYSVGSTTSTAASNALTFYCDDCVAVPMITSIGELTRPGVSTTSISGIATLNNSATALTVNMVVGVSSIGRFWFPIGPALTVNGAGASAVIGNTTSLSALIYSDAACTTLTTGALVAATTYYRKIPVVVSTVGQAALIETLAVSATASNIIGTSTAFAGAIGAFRYDPLSLALTLAFTGSRVVFSSATLYPDYSTAVLYDQSQSIVSNSGSAVYNSELIVYNGLVRGEADSSWQQNFASKGYSMNSTFYNYALASGATRYFTVQHTLASSSYNVLSIQLSGATGSMTGATVLYKFVDLAGSQTSTWRNVFVPLTGSGLGTGSDGSAGQYQASTSVYKTTTLCPSSSSSVVYVRVVMTAACTLVFRGIIVADTVTGTILI